MPETARPVRLTFPPREPGARKIMADGLQVGHALADYHYRWTAYLWNVASDPRMGFRGEVKGASLRQMREKVRGWLDERGPWWGAVPPDGRETPEIAATKEAG